MSRPRVFIPMKAGARSALSGPPPSLKTHAASTIEITEEDDHCMARHETHLYHDGMEMKVEMIPAEPEPESLLIMDEYTMPARERLLRLEEEDFVASEKFEDAQSLLEDKLGPGLLFTVKNE